MLLEGGDDLPDRRILLGVEALLPQHDEVGGLCAEGRHDDRCGKNDGSGAHGCASPWAFTASLAAFLAAATGSHVVVSVAREYPVIWRNASFSAPFLQRTLWDGGGKMPTI